MKIDTSVDIAQPPSVVYDFLLDEENLPLWLTNFIRWEEISGEPGEVGAVSRHVYNENGRTIELMEEITVLDKDRKLEARYTGNSFDMELAYRLEEAPDNGTRLRLLATIFPKSLFFKLTRPFFRSNMEKRFKNDFEKLKDAIEELTEIE